MKDHIRHCVKEFKLRECQLFHQHFTCEKLMKMLRIAENQLFPYVFYAKKLLKQLMFLSRADLARRLNIKYPWQKSN